LQIQAIATSHEIALVSPWTDLTLSGETLATKDDVDPLIHKAYLSELADAYLSGEVDDRTDPRVSPLYSGLKGFPPTLIQVGSAETLLSDATRFAAVAGAAGDFRRRARRRNYDGRLRQQASGGSSP
jgi:acetyl esterase/lipase